MKAELFIIYRAFTFLSHTAVVRSLDFSDFFQPFFFQGGLLIQYVLNNLKKNQEEELGVVVLLGIIIYFEWSPKGFMSSLQTSISGRGLLSRSALSRSMVM